MTAESDIREQLYNEGLTGLAHEIQLPRECVTRLHGLVVDLDADILKPNPWFPPADSPEQFLQGITPVLERHPILRAAEVRATGRWLHLLVRFQEPIELKSAADQQHWTAIHEILMGSVPADQSPPALITLTRALASINSKTGREVRTLRPGSPIGPCLLERWVQEVSARPFEAIGQILFGSQHIRPCPYCRRTGTTLNLGHHVGFCYGGCHQIPTGRLHEPFFKLEESGVKAHPQKGGEPNPS